jgi:hypothetical protein
MDAGPLGVPIAGHDVVATVAVEIGDRHLVTFDHLAEEHVPDPGAGPVLVVHDDLVAVPGFHGGEEPLAAHLPDRDVAGAEPRRLVLIVSRGEQAALPFQIRP